MKSSKDVKICVYAMAADEPQSFIDRWLESMKGADIITVLITKKDNPNFSYFKEKQKLPQFTEKLVVEEQEIKPWRFDSARNASMALIPKEGVDVCVCTDIDEILIPDFWDDLREMVFEHPNFERIYYQYAWSHDQETGEPKWHFWYDKIHKPEGWYWEYPVHEALRCADKQQLGYSGNYYMNADKIYLHHYPDTAKSRGSYLKLLELRAEEYPQDVYGLFYLGREYGFAQDWNKSLLTYLRSYALLVSHKTREQALLVDDMLMLPSLCCRIGNAFWKLGIKEDAEFYYKRALYYDPTFREAYISLAQLYAYQPDRYNDCYRVVKEMQEKSRYAVDWRLVDYYWRDWKVKQILADAVCWEGNYAKALTLIMEAIQDLKTDDDKRDALAEGFYGDLDFILEKNGMNSGEVLDGLR